jgi:DNA (cytosine-5)-methyltransferase 1
MLKAIDFFCGGGGMTYGLSMSGIKVLAGIDNDIQCKNTYEYNNPQSRFIYKDISIYSPEELENDLLLNKNDDELIFIGCSPCQFWTIINTDKTKSEKTKNLLADFGRFVKYFLPGFVLVENVPGLLQKSNESPLNDFLKLLESNGYNFDYGIVNMNDYGVPQSRKRFSLIASKNYTIKLPKPDDKGKTVKDIIGVKNGFPKIEAGIKDKTDFQHSCAGLSSVNLERLQRTEISGGSRCDWKNENKLQLKAYIGRDIDFKDNYGRMCWDKPAPTITTKFCSLSNGRFGHPEENRAISIREGATLQTFPKDYVFKVNSMGMAAKIIGNAVPPEFAKRLGVTINSLRK